MNNWTIGKRIVAGGALLISLLLLVSAVATFALTKITHEADARLRNDAIPGLNNMAEIGSLSMRGHIYTLMAGQSADPAKRDLYITQLRETVRSVDAAKTAYEASITQEEDRTNFQQFVLKRSAYGQQREAYFELIKAGKADAAEKLLFATVEPAFQAYRDQVVMLLKWNEAAAGHATDAIIATSSHARITTLVTSLVSLVIAILTGWIIIRGVNRILKEVTVQVDEASTQIASAAGQVAQGSQSLADGSSEQAASLEETSSSLEELSSMTKRNADSATNAKTLSGETRSAAETGNNDMNAMRTAMDAIKTSSADIAKIIKTIDEIAFQTNILALNAAVEAARAGEAGMGFAVVADEVRNLAQRSAESAKETASKIEVAIRNGENGVQICAKVAQSLDVIVAKAREVDLIVAEIATASNEQSQGIAQINTAVTQMDKVTQGNASSAEENAAAAEELNAQSNSLKEAVIELRRLVDNRSASSSISFDSPPTSKHAAPKARVTSPAASMRSTSKLTFPKPRVSGMASHHSPHGTTFVASSANNDHFKNFDSNE